MNTTVSNWNLSKKTCVENRDTARHLAGQDSLNKNMIMPGASTCGSSPAKKAPKEKAI